jgi:hypothetical protein
VAPPPMTSTSVLSVTICSAYLSEAGGPATSAGRPRGRPALRI